MKRIRVTGAEGVYGGPNADYRTGYRGTVTSVDPDDRDDRRVIWRCEHRHRLARKARDCAWDMAPSVPEPDVKEGAS